MKLQPRNKDLETTSPEAAPIAPAEFDELMEGLAFGGEPHLAVAVSGGPDSMALVFCAERWIGKQKSGKLLAFIVDHKLRLESTNEAEQTQKALAKIGIESEIIVWQHAPVVSRLHEVARKARYRLLTEACHRHGIKHLLLAHHSQDQAETILMRLAKGSGIDGLAGIPAQSTVGGVRILRPFLACTRERLISTCIMAGLPFVSDPSNDAPKYARGRLRKILPLLADEGLTIERLTDLGARAAEAKEALDHATAVLLRVAGKLDDAGVVHINLEHLRSAPQVIARRALAVCLQFLHPEDYAPEYVSLTRLADALCADADMTPCTLHGCLVGKSESHASIMREYAAIVHAPIIKPGEEILWDDRWLVHLQTDAAQIFTIRPLGNPPHEVLDRLAPGLRRQIPQGRARALLPSLWLNGVLALIPSLSCTARQSLAQAKPAFVWPPASDY